MRLLYFSSFQKSIVWKSEIICKKPEWKLYIQLLNYKRLWNKRKRYFNTVLPCNCKTHDWVFIGFLCTFLPQFGGLEAIITAVMDEYPDTLSHRRELLVLGLVVVCFLGSLSTLTNVSFSELLDLSLLNLPVQ